MLRAKMECASVQRTKNQEVVLLSPAQGPENQPWSKYTPSGQLSLTITNPEAFGQLEPGKYYFVDISAFEEEKPQ